MKCSAGHENAAGSQFCSTCGAKISSPEGAQSLELPSETREEYLARINKPAAAGKPTSTPKPKVALSPADRKKRNQGIGCLIVLVLIVIGAIASALGLTSGSDSGSVKGDGGQEVSDDRAAAADVCEQFVRDRLKAPDTATFRDPYGDQISYTGDGDGPITVDSSVDSENSFGAKLRSTYTCTVSRSEGDNWHLDNVDVQDGGG